MKEGQIPSYHGGVTEKGFFLTSLLYKSKNKNEFILVSLTSPFTIFHVEFEEGVKMIKQNMQSSLSTKIRPTGKGMFFR